MTREVRTDILGPGAKSIVARLKREIGAFGVFSIATGSMISSGIFILPGLAFSMVGPGLFLSYLIAGVLGLIGILSMIELATAMPKAGGDYYYVNKSFGPFVGSISGFLGWFALSFKSSFAIFGIAEIVFAYTGFNTLVSGLILCTLFVMLNILGTKEATSLQVVLVVGLLALMVVYIVSGIPRMNAGNFVRIADTNLNTIFVTSGFIFISFGGLLKVANISEEVNNPQKNLPLGMVGSVVVVTVLYVSMVLVMTGTLEPGSFAESLTPVADSAKITLGPAGYYIVLVASFLAFFTTANAGVMAASRYPLALSHDRLVPAMFGRVHRKTGTPTVAILVTGVLIGLSQLLPLETLVKAASTVVLSAYVLTNLSVIVLRESKITNYSPSFKAPLYPWLQIAAILLFTFFIIDLGLSAVEISITIVLIGVFVYLAYGRRRAKKESALLHLMRRIADRQLINATLEDELREIIIDRDDIEQDSFDRLLKKASFVDLEGQYDFVTFLQLVCRDIGNEVGMPTNEIQKRFEERQAQTDTALTQFLAVPHIIIEGTDTMFLHVVRARDGIRFSEGHDAVKAIFLLGGTKDVRVLHLKTIAAIASIISEDDFERRWMAADRPIDLKNLLLVNRRRRYP